MRAIPYRPDVQTATSSSYDGDGFLSVGVDGDADQTNLPPPEAVPPLGLMARPDDPGTDGSGNPLDGQSPTVLRLVGDDDDYVVPLTDPRVVGKLPQPAGKGWAMLYEPSAADPSVTDLARVMVNDDGQHRVLVHAAQGRKVVVEVAGASPQLTVTLDGAAAPPAVTVAVAGVPLLVVDQGGVHAGGPGGQPNALATPAFLSWLAAVGAATNVGAPPPIAAVNSKST